MSALRTPPVTSWCSCPTMACCSPATSCSTSARRSDGKARSPTGSPHWRGSKALSPAVVVPGHGPITDVHRSRRAARVPRVRTYAEARVQFDRGRTTLEAAQSIELGPYAGLDGAGAPGLPGRPGIPRVRWVDSGTSAVDTTRVFAEVAALREYFGRLRVSAGRGGGGRRRRRGRFARARGGRRRRRRAVLGVEVVLTAVACVVVVELSVDGGTTRVANVVGGSPERSGAVARSMSDVCASRGGSCGNSVVQPAKDFGGGLFAELAQTGRRSGVEPVVAARDDDSGRV